GTEHAIITLSQSVTLQQPADTGNPAQVDDGKDHDDALEDVDEVKRNVAEELDHGAAIAEGAEKEGGEQDAGRVTAAQQRNGDPGKAVARREMIDEAIVHAQDLQAAGEATDQPRQQEGDDDRPAEVDADGAREPGIEPRHAELVA